MTTAPHELNDLLALADRLNSVRLKPPPPLTHRAARQRDGPDRSCEPCRGIERVTGQIRPSERISRFSYRSREKS